MLKNHIAKKQLQLLLQLIRNSRRILVLIWKNHPKMVFTTIGLSILISLVPFVKSGVLALLVNTLGDVHSANPVRVVWLSVLAVAMILVPELLYGLKGYTDRWFGIDLYEYFKMTFISKRGTIDIATLEDPKFNDILNTLWEHDVWPILDMSTEML